MKINIGTDIKNLTHVDTKGIKFDDLTHRLVKALAYDALDNPAIVPSLTKEQKEKYWTQGFIIHGWAPSGRSKTPERK